MEISFLPVDLARWDLAPAGDLLAIAVWNDVRPPRGAAGLVDWRLCGAVSDALRQGRMDAEESPPTLLVPTTRLPWRSVMLVGLGRSAEFSEERYRATLRLVLEEAHNAGAEKLACALPGREAGRISPERAFTLLLTVAEQVRAERSSVEDAGPGVSYLTIVDTASASKVMADMVTRSSWVRLAVPRRPTAPVGAPVS